MITWISKPLAALTLLSAVSACEGTDASNALLAGFSPPSDAALPAPPLLQALMMRGKVTLVPPQGFCIDPDSLTQSFALMARCDTLGADTGTGGAPIGVLTVSFARSAAGATLPTAQEIATAAKLGVPSAVTPADASVVFRTSGAAPSRDLSAQHWRSVAQVGDFTMGAALFGPDGQRAVSEEGAGMLREMIRRTTQKTQAG